MRSSPTLAVVTFGRRETRGLPEIARTRPCGIGRTKARRGMGLALPSDPFGTVLPVRGYSRRCLAASAPDDC